MSTILYALYALIGGALIPVQTALNAQLAQATQSVPFAAFVSALVGSSVLAGLLATRHFGAINLTGLRSAPRWTFLGGLFGTVFILTSTTVISNLGATLTMSLVLSSQIAVGFLIDGFGWFGIPRRTLTRSRQVAGCLIFLAMGLLTLPELYSALEQVK